MKMRLITSLVLILFLLASAGSAWAQDDGPVGPQPWSGEGQPAETPPAPETQPSPAVETQPAEPPQPGTPNYPQEGVRLEDLAVQGGPAPEELQTLGGGGLNTGGFVFVLRGSSTGSSIDRYSADAGDGSLTYLGSTNTGQNGGALWNAHLLAYDAVNYRLYALHDASSTITAYSVDRMTGWLTPLPFSPISLGAGNWNAISLHPSGSPLIANNYSANSITSYRILGSATRGQPTVTAYPAGSYSTGSASGYSLAFSRDGQYFYAGGSDGTMMAGFTVNPTTGVLTALPGSPFDMGMANPMAYAIDPSGRIFMSAWSSNSSKIATTSAGVPTVVYTLSSNGLSQAVDGLYHPGGNFYLVADRRFGQIDGNQVGVYRISGSGEGSTLAAVAGSPFATGGIFTQALATNPSGSVVYALNSNSLTITRFNFNASTGALSGATTTTTPGAPGALQGIAYAKYDPLAATGGFVYALRRASNAENYIDTYTADTSGALTLLNSIPTGGNGFAGYTMPHSLVYDALNARLFALNDQTLSVSVFSINPVSGQPALIYTIPLLNNENIGLVIHPTGSPLLILGDTSVTSYQITASGAALAPGSPFLTGSAQPYDGIFSRNGDYFYTGGNSGNFIAGFSVNAATGVLTALAGSPYDAGMPFPSGFAADTLGRLFFTGWNTNSSKVATTSSGVPSVVSTLTPNNIINGSFGLIHPAGFYMIADRDANKVGVFRVTGSGAGTTLAAVAGSPFATGGGKTHFLALNETGKYLYAGNRNSGTITRFFVDGFSGGLAKVDDTTPVSAGAMVKGIVYAAKVTPGGFFYTLSNNAGAANYIYGYRLDRSTGALSLLNGFPVATGGNGDGYFYYLRLAYDALNHRLYALNAGSNTLSAYKVNALTGALTALPYSPYPLGAGDQPNSIAVHPQGSPVLVGGFSQLKSFNVTATTISLAVGSPITLPSSSSISTIVFSRDGAFAYTGESVLHGLSVNQASGVITLLAGSPFPTAGSPIPGPIDASGRLYASLMTASAFSVFTLNNAGAATTVHTTNFPGPGNCVGSTLHPAGYLVAACQIGIVGSYKINGSGAGTTLSPTGFGSMPGLNNIAHVPIFDSQYQYLVVMNVYSTLTSYKFDASNGELSPAGFMPQGAAGSGTFDGMVYAPIWSETYLPLVTR